MQRSTKKIKPEVDYRQFRFKKMNTPEFSHVKLLLFWPFFGLMFMFLERFQPERHYYVVHCALDDLIPFWEWALIPYLLWFVFLIGALILQDSINVRLVQEDVKIRIDLGFDSIVKSDDAVIQ